ncbi:MAG: hypothetical protein QF364_01735 [Candidatus Poseidoniaceae archaeon]|nr:hypothetical protein [Candidatus Poseidoniaceae archaeon]
MARKKKQTVELPDWAKPLWKDMGSPNLDEFADVYDGDLLVRRHGLRRDDFVEILLDARSIQSDEESWLRGRLLASGKSNIELLTEDRRTVFIARDIIAQIVLIAHTRPAYIDDKALLAFERADMKRRSKLHEKVEKETKGNDDSHLWG